jgi:hypothetical protein
VGGEEAAASEPPVPSGEVVDTAVMIARLAHTLGPVVLMAQGHFSLTEDEVS